MMCFGCKADSEVFRATVKKTQSRASMPALAKAKRKPVGQFLEETLANLKTPSKQKDPVVEELNGLLQVTVMFVHIILF